MKAIIFFLVTAAITAAQTHHAVPSDAGLKAISNTLIVSGLSRPSAYAHGAPCFVNNTGCGFSFVSGRRFRVSFQSDHGCDCIWVVDETGQRKPALASDFTGVWDKDGFQLGDLVFGQYDFTGELPNALLVISGRLPDPKDPEDMFTHCGVNVYLLQHDEWVLAGVMNANNVAGACSVEFKVNKVTIWRGVHGFYHQLTYQNGRFEDTSDF